MATKRRVQVVVHTRGGSSFTTPSFYSANSKEQIANNVLQDGNLIPFSGFEVECYIDETETKETMYIPRDNIDCVIVKEWEDDE